MKINYRDWELNRMIGRFKAALLAIALIYGGSAVMPDEVAAQALAGSGPTAKLLTDMVGRWEVEQTMRPGVDADPIALPRAIAVRRIAEGGGFLTENMTLAGGRGDPFTRTSHVTFNAIDGVFEYFSVDTRAPQQMHYRSQLSAPEFDGALQFSGGTFVAGQWGEARNVAFSYRVELSPVANDRQTMQLFLRPLASGPQREFVAFRYEYRKLAAR